MPDALLDETLRTHDYAFRLEGHDVAALRHLMGCPGCHDTARGLVAPPVPPEEDGGLWGRLQELMAFERWERKAVVFEERFRDLDLAVLLLAEAERLQAEHPAASDELAQLAQSIAEQPMAGRVEASDRVLARAACLRGNAARLLGNWRLAERFFRSAVAALTGPPVSYERGDYSRLLACLREEEGRFDEAVALLSRAAGIFRDLARAEEEGACLCQLGFLFLDHHDLVLAQSLLSQAYERLSLDRTPFLVARCGLGLAVCLAACGESVPAWDLLKAVRRLGRGAGTAERLRLEWLEGKALAHLGEHDQALVRLEAARKHLLAERKLLEAALCSVDVARVFAETGRMKRIQPLAEELVERFPASLDALRMSIALQDFADAVAEEVADLEEATLEAIDLVRRPLAILKTGRRWN
jgi:tetratricopeptide (TPR) repeat protein